MNTLLNQIIIAMPHMQDERFTKSVIFICEHNSYGAIGLIINKKMQKDFSSSVIIELNQRSDFKIKKSLALYFGGPVSTERGIILHDMNIPNNNSVKISDNLFMSSHIDSLKAIQSNKKCSYKFMMGYSGWSPGQLESEIENGDWVIQETSSDFIFNHDGQMWDIAIGSFGVEISNFSAHGGSA